MQAADAFDISVLELHRHAERNRAHDGDFMRGIHSFDIEGRVGFGISQALRIGQGGGKIDTALTHFGQDKIGRAVDDPGDPFDPVRRQPFA